MSKHRTSKGIPFDMDTIRLQNEKVIAAGNTPLNARGDVVGKGGKVIKKAEELTREFYNKTQAQTTNKATVKPKIEETAPVEEKEAKESTKSKKKNSPKVEETPPTVTKEVILDNGDIIVVDEDQDPSGGVDEH